MDISSIVLTDGSAQALANLLPATLTYYQGLLTPENETKLRARISGIKINGR